MADSRMLLTSPTMTLDLPVRRGLGAAALAAATAASLLLPAPPASATPVDGYVDAFGYVRSNVVDCDFSSPGTVHARREFTPATGRRTARVAQAFQASPAGDPTVTAHGRVENASSGLADADNGAFDQVTLRAEHLVRVTDDTAADCGMGLIADTQSGADLHVERRGRVYLEWDRGRAGQIEQIFVSRGGVTVVDRIRPSRHGDLRFSVRPGDYTLFVQFVTRANERDIPVGTTLTKRTTFRVFADYRR